MTHRDFLKRLATLISEYEIYNPENVEARIAFISEETPLQDYRIEHVWTGLDFELTYFGSNDEYEKQGGSV